MKKLLFLFTTLLLISCSSEDDSSSSDSSEIVGTYSFVVGCDTDCDVDPFYSYDCPTDYMEITALLFSSGYIDSDDCSDTDNWEEFNVSYEITKTDSQEIHGKLNFNELSSDLSYDYFVYNRSNKRFSRYMATDNSEASESNWDIKEVWQKN
jgi:hypothetical protein